MTLDRDAAFLLAHLAEGGMRDAISLLELCSGENRPITCEVVEEIAARLAEGEQGILGVMMESFLVAGNQKPAPLDRLVYGQSVTDSCIPWDRTEQLLHTLADAVETRRTAARA